MPQRIGTGFNENQNVVILKILGKYLLIEKKSGRYFPPNSPKGIYNPFEENVLNKKLCVLFRFSSSDK